MEKEDRELVRNFEEMFRKAEEERQRRNALLQELSDQLDQAKKEKEERDRKEQEKCCGMM